MRAAAAFEMSVRHFAVSRLALGGLCLLTALTLSAWVTAHLVPSPALAGTALFGVCLVAWFGARWRPMAVTLRWDTQRWHLGPGHIDLASADPAALPCGRVTVAIDLGPWLLLKFAADARPRSTVWLPIQKWGHAPQWHALRCTVYGAREVIDALNGAAMDAPARPSPAASTQ